MEVPVTNLLFGHTHYFCIYPNSLDNKGSCWILKNFYCSVTMLRELGLKSLRCVTFWYCTKCLVFIVILSLCQCILYTWIWCNIMCPCILNLWFTPVLEISFFLLWWIQFWILKILTNVFFLNFDNMFYQSFPAEKRYFLLVTDH